MTSVAMLEFRRNAGGILKRVMRGERMVLTYRGRPAIRLEPAEPAESPQRDDPFYRLAGLAGAGGGDADNTAIDEAVYGR